MLAVVNTEEGNRGRKGVKYWCVENMFSEVSRKRNMLLLLCAND